MNVHCGSTRVLVGVIVAGLLCVPASAQNSDFERGLTEFRAGNYSSAATTFAGTEASSPGTTDALLYEAKCLVHLDDFAGAEKALRRYLISHTNSADAAISSRLCSAPSEPARRIADRIHASCGDHTTNR